MNRNDRLVRLFIRKLTQARNKPPTVLSLLLTWPGFPLLFIVGVASVAILSSLDLPAAVPLLMAGVFIGAALRDLGLALKSVRLWPVQRELLDWQKVDDLAKRLDEMKEKPGTPK